MAAISESQSDPDSTQVSVEIVTPEGQFYTGRASLVELPGATGEIGVYPGHVPLFMELAPGEIRACHAGGPDSTEVFVIAGGYVQIERESVHVLAYFASPGEEEDKIEDACRRAAKALETAGELPPETIETDLALLRVELARVKKRKKQPPGR